jgi:hypothetical protein
LYASFAPMRVDFVAKLNAVALYAIGFALLAARILAGWPATLRLGRFEAGAIWLLLALALVNAGGALLQCG